MPKNTDKYEMIDISELHPYENNARTHSESQLEAICNSIKEFGFINPVIIDENNMILVGHGRIEASKRLGMTQAPFRRVTNLTDDQKKAYILADNRLSDLGGWDEEMLAQELESISLDMSAFGFEDFQIDIDEPEPEIAEDDFDVDGALEMESRVERGQVWKLGDHRLMCGDSTSADDVSKLMNGKKADMVFTDPPYNIASDSKNFASDVSKAMNDLSKSEWDMDFDIKKALKTIETAIAENVSVYICTSHFLAPDIWAWMKQWSNHYSYCIWSKPNPMPSLAKRHWTWNTELVCYATRGKHTFNFPKEGHALSTWTINKKNGETGHPTEKPVAVPSMAISHSSKENDTVLDLFGGSGSTLIACEQLNRKCFMMELDEHYCEVIIQRWESLTGKKAELIK